jgi:hypothetical protein
MNPQYKRPKKQGEPGCAQAHTSRTAFGASNLDTYKQSAQPNIHAGFKRF